VGKTVKSLKEYLSWAEDVTDLPPKLQAVFKQAGIRKLGTLPMAKKESDKVMNLEAAVSAIPGVGVTKKDKGNILYRIKDGGSDTTLSFYDTPKGFRAFLVKQA
jgi:hypothetical protein